MCADPVESRETVVKYRENFSLFDDISCDLLYSSGQQQGKGRRYGKIN